MLFKLYDGLNHEFIIFNRIPIKSGALVDFFYSFIHSNILKLFKFMSSYLYIQLNLMNLFSLPYIYLPAVRPENVMQIGSYKNIIKNNLGQF